jgi:hypothetical protein
LLAASEVRGYLRDLLISPRRSQEHLQTAQGESVFGAQPAKIGAFMATTVTHNPKSMLKMHLFQEGNIRLMKAEINLE